MKQILLLVVIAVMGLFSGSVYASGCSNGSNPLTITASCTELELTQSKSAVTVDSSVSVTDYPGPSGIFPAVSISGATLGSFTNNGTINALSTWVGTPASPRPASFVLDRSSSIASFVNNGTITSTATIGTNPEHTMWIGGRIGTFTNWGTVSADSLSTVAFTLDPSGSVGTFSNWGTISSQNTSIALKGGSGITTLNNYGTIQSAASNALQLDSGSNIAALTNYGRIQGAIGGASRADAISIAAGAAIGTITNIGTLEHVGCALGSCGAGINNAGKITTIYNVGDLTNGKIAGPSFTSHSYGIINTGTIGTLTNGQNNLTYFGALPTNYTALLFSPTDYGKMTVTGAGVSQTNFGVDSAIQIGTTTYSSVLTGINGSNLTATSGTYGGGLFHNTWTLTNNSSATQWDLTTTSQALLPDTGTSAGNSLATRIITAASSSSGSTIRLANSSTLRSAAQSLSADQADQLSSVHAEGYGSNMTIGLQQMAQVSQTVMDRIHAPMSSQKGGASTAYQIDEGRYVWIDGAGSTGKVNSYRGLGGFDFTAYDLLLGADIYRDSSGALGVFAGGGATSMTESTDVFQSFNTTNAFAGLYGGKYLPWNLKLSGSLGYVYGSNNATRNNINIGQFTGGASSSNYDVNGLYSAIKLSKPLFTNDVITLTPFVGLSYSQLWMEQAKESGRSDFNYTMSGATAYTAMTFLGGEAVIPLTNDVKMPLAMIGFYKFSYDWFANSGNAHTVTANSTLFGSFTQVGANMGPVQNLMGIGIQGNLMAGMSLRVGTVGSLNSNGWQVGGGGEFKWEF